MDFFTSGVNWVAAFLQIYCFTSQLYELRVVSRIDLVNRHTIENMSIFLRTLIILPKGNYS